MSRVSSRFSALADPGTAAGVNLSIASRLRPDGALFAKRRAAGSSLGDRPISGNWIDRHAARRAGLLSAPPLLAGGTYSDGSETARPVTARRDGHQSNATARRATNALLRHRRADSSPPTREVIHETAKRAIVTPAAIPALGRQGPECGRPHFHTEVICGN